MKAIPRMMNHLFDFKAKADCKTLLFPAKGITQKTGNVKEKMPLDLIARIHCFLFENKKGTE